VYSRPTVPETVYTGDSHSCERPTTVPDRPNRPRAWKEFLRLVLSLPLRLNKTTPVMN
jgi:hypothetical protein